MIEKIRYFLKEGLRSVWVNRMMSFASIIVLCVCLVMLGTTFLSAANINNFIVQLESKNQIMVYLDNDIDDAGITSVGSSIKAIPNISASEFLTKDQIFIEAQKTLGDQNVLLTGIDSSAFDCAYQVELKDLTKFSQTVAELGKIDGVKYVRQDEGLASILTNVKKVVSLTGFWLFVIMAVISLFIISNTIKITLFSRKREINIMKFVGATDWFIRCPFVIEGVILGIFSGAVALLVQYLIYTKLISGVINMLNITTPLNYSGELRIIAPGFLIGGVLVGALGSAVSVRRYLKV
jgi:cell division transport system permease protein